ncbi:MAG: class I tRNA ligase family protein, partial [bacterium]
MEEQNNQQNKSTSALREEAVLAFWKENQIFEKSLEKNKDGKPFVFFEGPPTANAKPALHHLEA